MDKIGLDDAISAVRHELMRAMEAGTGEGLRFRVDAVEMEFQAVVTTQADASAKVRFWVVEAGAGGTVGSESTHTIRVKLGPVTETGEEALFADQESGKPD